jgi:hypothetical protein
MIPLLVILTIPLLSNLKGEALNRPTGLVRLHQMRPKSSKLRLPILTLYRLRVNLKADLGKNPLLQRRLEGQLGKEKCLHFLTMSTVIKHQLK